MVQRDPSGPIIIGPEAPTTAQTAALAEPATLDR